MMGEERTGQVLHRKVGAGHDLDVLYTSERSLEIKWNMMLTPSFHTPEASYVQEATQSPPTLPSGGVSGPGSAEATAARTAKTKTEENMVVGGGLW
jgi:hypothetical protein